MNIQMPVYKPLRYKISDWHQLTSVLSNNSKKLHIRVVDYVQNADVNGVKIQVEHEQYGVLFACVIHAYGNLVSMQNDYYTYELTPAQILEELRKWGFIVYYNPSERLPGDQIQYLMTINQLHFDKIRLLHITSTEYSVKLDKTVLVAFMADRLPKWLDPKYCARLEEYNRAIGEGHAMSLSAISEVQKYDWSWLVNIVASIEDILKDNA